MRRIEIGLCLLLAAACGRARAGDLSADNVTVFNGVTSYGTLNVYTGLVAGSAQVLTYHMDQNGTNVVDASQYGNNGTVYSATWVSTGHTGGAYAFDDGRYMNVAFGSELEFSGPFSIAAWIWPQMPASQWSPGIVAKGADSSSVEYGLMWGYGNNIGFYSTGGSSSLWTTNSPTPTNAWAHVVAVLEGSGANQAKIYVNGSLVRQGTLNLPSTYSPARPLYVGRWRDSYYFKGMIDEVYLFNRALTAGEVGELYGSGTGTINAVFGVSGSGVTITPPTTILRLVPQGDIGMGVYTNGP